MVLPTAGGRLQLSNGLISREFMMEANSYFATIDLFSTEAETSLLRYKN